MSTHRTSSLLAKVAVEIGELRRFCQLNTFSLGRRRSTCDSDTRLLLISGVMMEELNSVMKTGEVRANQTKQYVEVPHT